MMQVMDSSLDEKTSEVYRFFKDASGLLSPTTPFTPSLFSCFIFKIIHCLYTLYISATVYRPLRSPLTVVSI